jgi:hypothetical protein
MTPKARMWATIGGLAVLALAGSVAVFLLHLAPFRTGSSDSTVPPSLQLESHGRTQTLRFQRGARVREGLELANDGMVPVEIVGFSLPPSESLLSLAAVEMAKAGAGSGSDDPALRSFGPFTLSGGESRWVVLRLQMSGCHSVPRGSTTTVAAVDVTFRVFGIQRHQQISLPVTFEVARPKSCR